MKFLEKFTSMQQVLVVLILGLIAGVAEFGFKMPEVVQGIMIFIGIALCFIMLVEMIETFKEGMFGVDILAVTAILATLYVGEYWATFMLTVMITGGGALEEYAHGQASRELEALLENNPQSAHVIRGEETVDIPVSQVKVGDVILVRANELVPVDGILLDEHASLDQSQMTGESLPISITKGEEVLSGTLNQENAFRVEVTKSAEESSYQQLVKLVEESKDRPANFVRLADRYAVPFTIIAYVIAFAAWVITGNVTRFAEVLVVASPCPLLISAPMAMISGISRSSANGIIVKSGTTLEKMAKAKTIAFDKTGTITAGRLAVDKVVVENDKLNENELLRLAASVEQSSPHVLARSIISETQDRDIDIKVAHNVEEVTAQGVKGTIDGHVVKAGKAEFAHAEGVNIDQTAVFVSVDDEYVGYISFEDVIRPESKATIARLKDLGVENTVMLTGDRASIAEKIREESGVASVKAELLPQDKIDIIDTIAENQRPVVMVGDGVNDAPALAAADVGIAMGAHGATAASETADAVIVKDDLSKVSDLMGIAKRTLSVAKESVLIGIILSIGLMFVAAFGLIPAFWGAVAQEGLDLVSMVLALRARTPGKEERK